MCFFALLLTYVETTVANKRTLLCKLVQKVIKPCLAHTQHNISQKSTQCNEIPDINYSPSNMGVGYTGS